jgi:hypothetical protein
VLDLQVVDEPDWTPTLQRDGQVFVKAMASHLCRIDFASRHILVRLATNLGPVDWYFVFRDIFAALCGLSGDTLLHASAVAHRGEAHAFCAYSGGGKSTIAYMLANEPDIISDEVNWAFLDPQGNPRLVDQRYYRFPALGDSPTLPLRSVNIIRQAPSCALLPLSTAETYPILLAAPFGNDPLLPARSLSAARLAALPVVRGLQFSLDRADLHACLDWHDPAEDAP